MITLISERNSALKLTWILGLIGVVLSMTTAFGSSEGRNYLQYIPLTPFIGDEKTSHDYMKLKEPISPWKAAASQPTWEQVILYKQKLESIREKNKELESDARTSPEAPLKSETLPPVPTDIKLRAPSLKWEEQYQSRENTPTDVTVSPWFNIQTPPASTSGSPGNTSKPIPPGLAPSGETPWLQKPTIGGSDIYIPFSALPGVNAPPTATSPSAVIYSQPKATGTE